MGKKKKINKWYLLYLVMPILYVLPVILGDIASGHLMFHRYLILKQYWFADWNGMIYVKFGLFILLALTIVHFVLRYRKLESVRVKTVITLLANGYALKVVFTDPFAEYAYYFWFIVVLFNAVFAFFMQVLTFRKAKMKSEIST